MGDFGHNVRITAGPRGQKGLSWSSTIQEPGLRMQFEIVRSTDEEPNDCKVTLYNLSKRSRAFLQQEADTVVVEAGVGIFGLAGSLDVANVVSTRQNNDMVTVITGGDAGAVYQSARINTALSPGATYRDAFDACARSMGIPLAYAPPVSEKQFPTGVTLYGWTRDVLADLTPTLGLEWSLQDNELLVLARGKARPGRALLVSPETGLIDRVRQVVVDDTTGVEFSVRLDARYQPGVLVQAGRDGIYRVSRVRHAGDSYEPTDFRSEVTALELS